MRTKAELRTAILMARRAVSPREHAVEAQALARHLAALITETATVCAYVPVGSEPGSVDLVDTLHVAVSPVELGAGSRLWQSPDELDDRFHHDIVPSPSGVTHHLFWRR